MDYQSYDKYTSESHEDYSAFVAWLSNLTVTELREAKPDPAKQKQVLSRYYKRGERTNVTAGERGDSLGVGTPLILHRAGCTDAESIALREISDGIAEEDILLVALPDAV